MALNNKEIELLIKASMGEYDMRYSLKDSLFCLNINGREGYIESSNTKIIVRIEDSIMNTTSSCMIYAPIMDKLIKSATTKKEINIHFLSCIDNGKTFTVKVEDSSLKQPKNTAFMTTYTVNLPTDSKDKYPYTDRIIGRYENINKEVDKLTFKLFLQEVSKKEKGLKALTILEKKLFDDIEKVYTDYPDLMNLIKEENEKSIKICLKIKLKTNKFIYIALLITPLDINE